MRQLLLLGLTFAAAMDPAAGQVAPDRTVVATNVPAGPPATRLLAIDSLGAIANYGSFPSDAAAPRAVAIDPYDRHIVLAVALGGMSRLLRLVPDGSSFTQEIVLGDVAGVCVQVEVVDDHIFAVVEGAAGGVYRLPRHGGQPVQTVFRPNAAALMPFGFGTVGILAWSGTTAPSATDPGLEFLDFDTGQLQWGPFSWPGFQPLQVTGLIDLPTGASRQLLAFADGTFAVHLAGAGNPTPLPVSPPVPMGGARAFKVDSGGAVGIGLGGISHPWLYSIDAFTGMRTILSGPLPGDPVDFALPLAPFPQLLAFGSDCGGAPPPSLVLGAGGPPQIGNSSFDVLLGSAAPGQLVVFFAGLTDMLPGLLPFPLAGGCLLRVRPDFGELYLANIGGGARQPLPIPNQASLAGQVILAQWLTVQGPQFGATRAVAIALGP
ncbi:MAG: hypothetical protein ABIP94_17030 [Planctomycetota bacterium]